MAVSIGDRVEKRMKCSGSADAMISLLESYCEDVYNAYQKEGSVDIEDIRRLRAYEEMFDDIFKDINEKLEVVFLCYMTEHWKSLHTIWESAVADDSVHVTVIPVPYYLKETDGSTDKDEMIIEDGGYPPEVELTPYDQYDMEAEHPDVIIYQCPYDEYSTAVTVHPYYYVSNLYQFAEKLVFIPPFYTRDIDDADKRIRSTLRDFICNPGIIYADQIIVQSEGVKRAYEEILSGFVRDELGDREDEALKVKINAKGKVIACGTAIHDWESKGRDLMHFSDKCYTYDGLETTATMYDRVRDIPDDWMRSIKKDDGSFKKILVYYISGSMIYDHEIPEIKRVGRVIDMMQSHSQDIAILWFADKYAEDILKSRKPKVWDAYAAVMERFKSEEIGIFDETGDADRAAAICAGFYGDAGLLMNKCRNLGKPVMWETPGTQVGE